MTHSRRILTRCAGAALLLVSLSACSVTETISNFLSSTSGKSWFEDGVIKADHRVQGDPGVHHDPPFEGLHRRSELIGPA